MENEGYQKELFEFDEKSRKSFPQFEKMLPKADFEGKVNVTLGLDRVVFIAMGIILFMVVVFAIGVERGRAMERISIDTLKEKAAAAVAAPQAPGAVTVQTAPAQPPAPAAQNKASQAPAARTSVTQPARTTAAQPQKTSPAPAAPLRPVAVALAAPVAQAAAPKPNTIDDIGAMPYTIVAGSFKGKDAAQLAANRLKKEGFTAYLAQNDPYYVVCVGGYSNRDAAQATFTKIKRLYKDAYIKLR